MRLLLHVLRLGDEVYFSCGLAFRDWQFFLQIGDQVFILHVDSHFLLGLVNGVARGDLVRHDIPHLRRLLRLRQFNDERAFRVDIVLVNERVGLDRVLPNEDEHAVGHGVVLDRLASEVEAAKLADVLEKRRQEQMALTVQLHPLVLEQSFLVGAVLVEGDVDRATVEDA